MSNIYKLALDVQNASNPSGVVISLANEVMPAIRLEAGYREQGTQYMRTHPALLLFLDKLVSMTNVGYIHDTDMQIADAYDACTARAAEIEAAERAAREANEVAF
jgi:hypothetical protein